MDAVGVEKSLEPHRENARRSVHKGSVGSRFEALVARTGKRTLHKYAAANFCTRNGVLPEHKEDRQGQRERPSGRPIQWTLSDVKVNLCVRVLP